MFEARIAQGSLLKKLLDAIEKLVTDANFEVTAAGLSLQAMDSSHVALVTLQLRSDGFEHFRCDRNRQIGVSVASLQKVVKCAGNEDRITLKADDTGDTMTLMFESPNEEKISTFEIKLMNIDAEYLGVPDHAYNAVVKLPAPEFQRVCRDIAQLGDTVTISVAKDSVKFSTEGELGSANISLKQYANVDKGDEAVTIELSEPIAQTYAIRYLGNFSKATPLSEQVILSLGDGTPLNVCYNVSNMGHIRYFLAPKVEEDAEEGEEDDTGATLE